MVAIVIIFVLSSPSDDCAIRQARLFIENQLRVELLQAPQSGACGAGKGNIEEELVKQDGRDGCI